MNAVIVPRTLEGEIMGLGDIRLTLGDAYPPVAATLYFPTPTDPIEIDSVDLEIWSIPPTGDPTEMLLLIACALGTPLDVDGETQLTVTAPFTAVDTTTLGVGDFHARFRVTLSDDAEFSIRERRDTDAPFLVTVRA